MIRDWIHDERYNLHGMNVMLAAEKMCKSSHWLDALNAAREYRGNGCKNDCQTAALLWKRTAESKGSCGDAGIRFRKNGKDGWQTSGKGGPRYGVTVSARRSASRGGVLETMLHEIVHVVHLSDMRAPIVSGVRRPHDMDFNIILCHMAKSLWGFPFTPEQAGYSVGKGYRPSRRLEEWMHNQIKSGNPRIHRWLADVSHPSSIMRNKK